MLPHDARLYPRGAPAPTRAPADRDHHLRACIDELTGRGVSFERYDRLPQDECGIWRSPSGAQVAWFKDPDGNTLSLTQFA